MALKGGGAVEDSDLEDGDQSADAEAKSVLMLKIMANVELSLSCVGARERAVHFCGRRI